MSGKEEEEVGAAVALGAMICGSNIVGFFSEKTVLHNVVLLRTRSPAPARSQVNLANAESASKEEEEEDDDEEEEEEQAPPWRNISARGGVDSGGGKKDFFCTLDCIK